ncbi:MAG TPA: tyrosine-type recombinase/integrase [Burkholderiales bacterium]|nr:tyrosine-type recombinase/integrase [Burkholderiales bacterium]
MKHGRWQRLGTDLPSVLAEYGRRMAPQSQSPIGKLIDKAIAHASPSLAPSSARQYREVAERLKLILVEFQPDQVRAKHIAAIKIAMAKTPNMANRVLSVARLIFGLWVEWQLIDSNPCVGVRPYKEKGRDRYITAAERVAIREKAGPRLQVIMDLQYLTGQRISDVLKLRLDQLTDAGIVFQQQKTKARLSVEWTPELRAVVERAKALYGKVRPLKTLLCNRRGKAPDYSTVHLQWMTACRAAGVEDARPNDLRAEAITDVDEAGGDSTGLAGHTSRAMTRRYIRNRKPKVVQGPRVLDVSNKTA